MIPCEFLATCGNKHYCGLIIENTMTHKEIGIGRGCDAKTQQERIDELMEV